LPKIAMSANSSGGGGGSRPSRTRPLRMQVFLTCSLSRGESYRDISGHVRGLSMVNTYKFCKNQILIQPPGEPREQHLGDVGPKKFELHKIS